MVVNWAKNICFVNMQNFFLLNSKKKSCLVSSLVSSPEVSRHALLVNWSTITQPLNVIVYISEEFQNPSSPPLKDVMPALRRRGKLLVLHNSVKENFSILCDVLQLSSADKIAAKLVKSYISDKLKFSKYPSKHRRSLAITAGCLVVLICLGTNQNYIRGSSYPFTVFVRPAWHVCPSQSLAVISN